MPNPLLTPINEKTINELLKLSVHIESLGGVPEVNSSGARPLGEGANNDVYGFEGASYVVRVAKRPLVDEGLKTSELYTAAVLRSLPPSPYLHLPKRVSFASSKVTSVSDLAGGSLYKKLGDINDIDQVRVIFAQIVLGLEVLHSKNLPHRDLKTDNILVTGNIDDATPERVFSETPPFKLTCKVQLADLDSVLLSSTVMCGTVRTFSPPLYYEYIESHSNKLSHRKLPESSFQQMFADDIWALGILLTEMVEKKGCQNCLVNELEHAPYQRDHVLENERKKWADKVKRYLHDNGKRHLLADSDLKDLILRLLDFDEHQRIQLQDIKKHPFIQPLVARLQSIQDPEIDSTTTPFWPLSAAIRNFVNKLLTLPPFGEVLDVDSEEEAQDEVRYVKLGLTTNAKAIVRLIDETLALKDKGGIDRCFYKLMKLLLQTLLYEDVKNYLDDETVQDFNARLAKLQETLSRNSPTFTPEETNGEGSASTVTVNTTDARKAGETHAYEQYISGLVGVLLSAVKAFESECEHPGLELTIARDALRQAVMLWFSPECRDESLFVDLVAEREEALAKKRMRSDEPLFFKDQARMTFFKQVETESRPVGNNKKVMPGFVEYVTGMII